MIHNTNWRDAEWDYRNLCLGLLRSCEKPCMGAYYWRPPPLASRLSLHTAERGVLIDRLQGMEACEKLIERYGLCKITGKRSQIWNAVCFLYYCCDACLYARMCLAIQLQQSTIPADINFQLVVKSHISYSQCFLLSSKTMLENTAIDDGERLY